MNNYFELKLKSISANEKFARNTVGAFAVQLNPTISELDDIKTAVSEAVTNCIVHGYNYDKEKYIYITASIEGNILSVTIKDEGIGIPDVELAMTPFYTTKESEERSGMGFTLMQSFSDSMNVYSEPNKGTIVVMTKKIGKEDGNVK